IILVSILYLFLLTSTVHAQEVLSPNAPPDHDGLALGVGFAPDPLPVAGIIGGGSIDLGQENMGADCRGYVTAQPDFRINVVYPFSFLRFILVSDSLLNDMTMVIRTPGGAYVCNDDSFDIDNPTLDFRDLEMGEYNIWLGNIAPNSTAQATLYITISEAIYPSSTGLVMPFAAPVVTPTPAGVVLPTPIPGTFMDEQAAPANGEVVLEHGFLPDPFWEVLVGGGGVSVPPHDAQAGTTDEAQCGGYTTGRPQMSLQWQGDSTRLRIFFVPNDGLDADMGLAILSPDGWACNRDFAPGFTQPQVEFINPAAGTYTIWVTHETSPNTLVSGVLYVTEKQYYPSYVPVVASASVELVAGLDAAAAPTQGSLDLAADFEPDPLTLPMTAGGPFDLETVNPSLPAQSHCVGFYNSAPNAIFRLNVPLTYMRLFFLADEAGADATIVLRASDGRWYCNDDSYNAVNPTLNVIGAPAGTYQVWLGSFGLEAAIPGTFYLTQTDATPLRPTGRVRIGVPNE
ncbi:MAG: hypothetical protein KC519_02530, partial [Anaerolineae bacterium]|nr:hypothetical protein [Anaerolineae bacterium]